MIIKVNSPTDNMKASRHAKRRLKSVKNENSRFIVLDYIQTSNNLADRFLKSLSQNMIDNASKEMDMRPTL
jgi:hypothetical protein